MSEKSTESKDWCLAFLALVVFFLWFALFNGAPLIRPDTNRYDGAGWHSPEFHPLTLLFLMRPIFTLGGIWAVLFVQVVVVSYAMARFAHKAFPQGGAPFVLTAAALSLSFFYVDLLMADIYALVVFMMVYLAINEPRLHPLDAGILVLACAAHNANALLAVLGLVVAMVIFRPPWRRALSVVGCVLAAYMFTAGLHQVFFPDAARLRFGFLANDILVEAPEILWGKCQEDADFILCQEPYKGFIDTQGQDAGQLLWGESSLINPKSGLGEARLELRDFEHASREFVFYALRQPIWNLRFSASRVLALLKTNPLYFFGFPENWRNFFQNRYDSQWIYFDRSLQLQDVWINSHMRRIGTLATNSTIGLSVGFIFLSLFWRDWDSVRLVGYSLACLLTNDILMAALSGPVARFHFRTFFLLGIPAAMLLWKLPYFGNKVWRQLRPGQATAEVTGELNEES